MTRVTVLLSAAAFVAVLSYAQPARACDCMAGQGGKGECPRAKDGKAKCEEGAKAGDCKCGKAGADCTCGGDCKCGEGECSCMKDGAKKDGAKPAGAKKDGAKPAGAKETEPRR